MKWAIAGSASIDGVRHESYIELVRRVREICQSQPSEMKFAPEGDLAWRIFQKVYEFKVADGFDSDLTLCLGVSEQRFTFEDSLGDIPQRLRDSMQQIIDERRWILLQADNINDSLRVQRNEVLLKGIDNFLLLNNHEGMPYNSLKQDALRLIGEDGIEEFEL